MPEAKDQKGGRLGGASADFVASLGRKISDARDVLRVLEGDTANTRARDDLRRKIHALGAGARLLRFEAMTRALGDAETVLERATKNGKVKLDDLMFVSAALDDLPALAWGDAPTREPPRVEGMISDTPPPPQPMPFAALVVGDEALGEALAGEGASSAGRAFECERTEDVQAAVDLARAYAPDLVIVDADLDAAPELVEALLDDPLTEPVPLIVVGDFSPDRVARFTALGVAKLLPKPVAPELLRRACEEVLDQREGKTMRFTLGEPTLEQLGDRLAEEVRRAIVESVDKPARSVRVPLGEGTEVLGAIWGAIARVQEVISAKTEGSVRYGGTTPEGAIALAPWLHRDVPGADRMRGRGRGAAADVRLDRRRVVVADDDPGVTWFISDLLRTAGCEVHEALDGDTALETAYRVSPELVVSDILMPGLDGFALCRALKRDVALRDTPVILLSWKEDLLQRVRELGASAAAYLKKESDARAILARVREVLRPRARIEQRLRGNDEVRGRLDGLTVRLLLELACTLRPMGARVAVRDASFLYEVDVKDGAPRRATRTAPDGSFQRGERVLARMLGASAGRFVVSPLREHIREELSGSLAEQLAKPVAHARGALYATTGARTINVESIVLDDAGLEDDLAATPEQAREIIERLASGASPRQMLLRGEVAPSLLEDVLADLAAHGAIAAVRGANDADLLKPAFDAALAMYEGRMPVRRSTLPPPSRGAAAAMAAAGRADRIPSPPRAPSDPIAREIAALSAARGPTPPPPATHPPVAQAAAPEPSKAVAALEDGRPPQTYESLTLSEPPPPIPSQPDSDVPSSLEDALAHHLSGQFVAESPLGSNPPPIVEPSELRPRSSNPPSYPSMHAAQPREFEPLPLPALPSIPPDAVVPATGSDEMQAALPNAPPSPRPSPPITMPVPAAPPVPAFASPPSFSTRGQTQRLVMPPRPPKDALAELSEQTEVDAQAEERPPASPPRELTMPIAPPPRRELSMPLYARPAAPASVPAPAMSAAAPIAPHAPHAHAAQVLAAAPPAPLPAPIAEEPQRTPLSSVKVVRPAAELPAASPRKRASSGWGLVAAIALVGLVVGVGLRWSMPAQPSQQAAQTQAQTQRPAASPPAAPAPTPLLAPKPDDSSFAEIPVGITVPDGQGYLSITAAPDALIQIDGVQKGRGPKLGVALKSGYHEVHVGPPTSNLQRSFEVRPGKASSADMTK